MAEEQEKKRLKNLISRAFLINSHLLKIVEAEKAATEKSSDRFPQIPGLFNTVPRPGQAGSDSFDWASYWRVLLEYKAKKAIEIENLLHILTRIYGLLKRYQDLFKHDLEIDEGIKTHLHQLEQRLRIEMEMRQKNRLALHYYPNAAAGTDRRVDRNNFSELEIAALEKLRQEITNETSEEQNMQREIEFLFQTFIKTGREAIETDNSIAGYLQRGILGSSHTLPTAYNTYKQVVIHALSPELANEFKTYCEKFFGIIKELITELSKDKNLAQHINEELEKIFAIFRQPISEGQGNASERRAIQELEKAYGSI